MPIDPSELTKSIGAIGSLDPEQGLAPTLQQVVVAAKQLFEADGAGQMLTDRQVPGSVEPHPDRLAAGGRDRGGPGEHGEGGVPAATAAPGAACPWPAMDAPRARRRTCLWRAGLLGGRRGAARPASVHLWYARWSSYRWSAAISRRWVATWPETATAVAVRLDGNDQLQITTACGLQDLLQGVSRRNPRREVSSGIASCGNARPASPRPRRGWCCRW